MLTNKYVDGPRPKIFDLSDGELMVLIEEYRARKKKTGVPRQPGQPSYENVHRRLNLEVGPARLHLCVECGQEEAREWAYDGADPNEWQGKGSHGYFMRYSEKFEHYRPMCFGCHRRFDREIRTP